MIPSKPRFVLALAALGLLTYASIARVGPVPPVIPFLDPVRGVWAVARTAVLPQEASGTVPGLSAPARVFYDLRGVPHVFAANSATHIARSVRGGARTGCSSWRCRRARRRAR